MSERSKLSTAKNIFKYFISPIIIGYVIMKGTNLISPQKIEGASEYSRNVSRHNKEALQTVLTDIKTRLDDEKEKKNRPTASV
eukprot:ANDGO_03914.mRNA.1 hypothetical protein